MIICTKTNDPREVSALRKMGWENGRDHGDYVTYEWDTAKHDGRWPFAAWSETQGMSFILTNFPALQKLVEEWTELTRQIYVIEKCKGAFAASINGTYLNADVIDVAKTEVLNVLQDKVADVKKSILALGVDPEH